MKVWTDGSYSPQSGFGGWAWVLEDESRFNHGGCTLGESAFTMEIRAVLEALRNLSGDLHIYSDNDGLIRVLNQHPTNLRLWVTGNRRKREAFPLVHDLLLLVEEQMRGRKVSYEHVKGHNGDPNNTRADRLARQARKNVRDLP